MPREMHFYGLVTFENGFLAREVGHQEIDRFLTLVLPRFVYGQVRFFMKLVQYP